MGTERLLSLSPLSPLRPAAGRTECLYGVFLLRCLCLYSLDRHLVAQLLGGSEARSVLLLRAFVSLLDLSDKDVSRHPNPSPCLLYS